MMAQPYILDDTLDDPDTPQSISIDDVIHAKARIKETIKKTPCTPSHYQKEFSMNLFYKNEFLHRTGSFKERGALNVLSKLALDNNKRGVVSASIGNHALSLCYHAARLKVPVTIVMPETVPIIKQEQCQKLGAKVMIHGTTLLEARSHARELAIEKKLTLIHGRDNLNMIAGFGTVALEILEQVPLVDAVIVPVGSGGLIAGVATVIKKMKPNCLVYGVQTEKMPGFFKSLERGEPVTIGEESTMAPNIGIAYVGTNAFHMAKSLVDKLVLVGEDCIARAILHLVEVERFVVEGAGAATLATIIGKLVPELKTKIVVCILTGGNIGTPFLSRCLERGLAVEARLVKFKVNIKDTSKANGDLMRLLGTGGFSVIRQIPDRVWVEGDIYTVEVLFSKITDKRIYYAWEDSKDAARIISDLSKAFDCVNHQTLLYKLKYYGVYGDANRLLESYLQNRIQKMKLVCEAKNLEHALKLKKMIEHAYPGGSTFETAPLNDKRLCPCVTTKVVKM